MVSNNGILRSNNNKELDNNITNIKYRTFEHFNNMFLKKYPSVDY